MVDRDTIQTPHARFGAMLRAADGAYMVDNLAFSATESDTAPASQELDVFRASTAVRPIRRLGLALKARQADWKAAYGAHFAPCEDDAEDMPTAPPTIRVEDNSERGGRREISQEDQDRNEKDNVPNGPFAKVWHTRRSLSSAHSPRAPLKRAPQVAALARFGGKTEPAPWRLHTIRIRRRWQDGVGASEAQERTVGQTVPGQAKTLERRVRNENRRFSHLAPMRFDFAGRTSYDGTGAIRASSPVSGGHPRRFERASGGRASEIIAGHRPALEARIARYRSSRTRTARPSVPPEVASRLRIERFPLGWRYDRAGTRGRSRSRHGRCRAPGLHRSISSKAGGQIQKKSPA